VGEKKRSPIFSCIRAKRSVARCPTRGSGSRWLTKTLTEQPNSSAIGDLKHTQRDAAHGEATYDEIKPRRIFQHWCKELMRFLFPRRPPKLLSPPVGFETESVISIIRSGWAFSAFFFKAGGTFVSRGMTGFTFHLEDRIADGSLSPECGTKKPFLPELDPHPKWR